MNPESNAYNNNFIYKLTGNLNVDVFCDAIKFIINKFDLGKSNFIEEGNKLKIVVNEILDHQKYLFFFDIEENKNSLEKIISDIVHVPFVLTKPPLFRLALIRTAPGQYLFVGCFHHIITDGQFFRFFINDLGVVYNKSVKNESVDTIEITPPLENYLNFEKETYIEQKKQEDVRYWLELIGNDGLSIQLVKPKGMNAGIASAEYFSFDKETSAKIAALIKQERTTPFMFLSAIWGILLSRYSGQKNIFMNYPVNIRPPQFYNLYGCFNNNVLVKVSLDNKKTFKDVIKELTLQRKETKRHQKLPYNELIYELRQSNIEDNSNVSIVEVPLRMNTPFNLDGIHVEGLPPKEEVAINHLVLEFEKTDKFNIRINYDSELFEKVYITQLIRHFNMLIGRCIENINMEINSFSLLEEREYQKIVYDWNQTEAVYPKHKTIQQLFEEQVEKTPDNIAVVFEDNQLTYHELNERANQLAHTIRKEYKSLWNEEVKGDTLIGVYVERSLEMIIGILGILKSGAAYVPFDFADPQERLKFKINDCGCKMVLTSLFCVEDLIFTAESDTLPLAIDSYWEEIEKAPRINYHQIIKSTDLAYVIYTSGSTGSPKGVMQLHYNVLRLFNSCNNHFEFTDKDVWTLFHSCSFDFSVWEIWGALLFGGKLLIPNYEQTRDTTLFYSLLEKHKVTVLNQTPSAFYQLTNVDNTRDKNLNSLRYVVFGGEALNFTLLKSWFDKYGYTSPYLVNMYGITETTVHVTYKLITPDDMKVSISNIGKKLSDLTSYVLDEKLIPVPIGIPGELYVGGDGLARGYLNRPDLTKERFISNPFAAEEDKAKGRNLRIYKTGDLVCWLPDGNLEFIGRNDDQVKIRGFRIELGEIESKLLERSDISQCVVIVHEQSKTDNKQLRAYYVPDKNNIDNDPKQAETALIDTWESIYDTEYGNISEKYMSNNDFSTWNSSYTDKAISVNEMIEWRDTTIKRILSLKPSFVYEIGSGTGLMAFPLSEHLKKYVGIDFSSEVVRRLNCSFSEKSISKARAYKGRADELDKMDFFKDDIDIAIDTIIFNSVIQYFPDIEYLEDVLTKAISMIDTGSIFVGDVRDYRLLNEFHMSIELFKYYNTDSSDFDIASSVGNNIKNENELLVVPDYFIALSRRISKISCVEILPKRGNSLHEMNKYRYDVVIHINKVPKENGESELKWVEFNSDISLDKRLREDVEYLALHNYPSKRIMNDSKIIEFLSDGNDKIISEYEKLNQQYDSIYTVEDLYELAEALNYELYISLSLADKSCYDLIFCKGGKGNMADLKNQLYKENCMKLLPESYSNDPLKSLQKRKIPTQKLRDYLLSCLPDYMVPSFFVELEELPLNVSGKIDRQALLDVEFSEDKSNYAAPQTELEGQLAAIWQEVLGIDKVGMNDDCFKIGGNSILAIRLSHSMSKQLKINIAVADIFRYRTIEKIISSISESKNIVIPKFNLEKYPLSFAQERLFFINEYEGGTNAYNIPVVFKIKNVVDTDVLLASLIELVNRHETLRTTFYESSGNYFQKINHEKLKISNHSIGAQKEFDTLIEQCINHIFDLKTDYPVKVDFIRFQKENYFSMVIHHIAFDGWSADIFLKELNEIYQSKTESRQSILPDLSITYKDFSVWQREYLSGEVLDKQLAFWKDSLNGYENLNLPVDKQRPTQVSYMGEHFLFELPEELSYKLRSLAKRKSVTLYTLLLGCFKILLSKYTNQTDIIVGTPLANRHFKGTENLIGFFVNTLPIRAKIDSEESIEALIEQLNSLIINVQLHQDISFEKIVDELDIEKDLSRNPIFQVLFGVQSFGSAVTGLFKRYNLERLYKISKFDLSLFIDDGSKDLKCNIEYATSLFCKDTITKLSEHFRSILEQAVNDAKTPIRDIRLLTEKEYQTIVYDWNKTEIPYPENKTIHQLFEEQVEKTPDNIAVVFEDKQLTYRELNEKANQLAHTIRKEYKDLWNEQVKGDTLIGLYIDRSFEMIIGILGILKSGAAYVPFDIAEPKERLKFDINDCNCKMVITSLSSVENLIFLSDSDTLSVAIDSYWEEIEKAPRDNPEHINKSTDLAYMIYTSGSTGKPKGVMVEHKGVVNLLESLDTVYDYDKQMMKSTFFTSYAFDVSVSEIFVPLIRGSELHILSEQLKKSPRELAAYIEYKQINYLYLPPVLLSVLPKREYKSLKTIIYAGEPCGEKTASYWSKKKRLFNLYGPTEATIYALGKQIINNEVGQIGKPISNVTAYVLDKYMHLVPIGVSGELYIGGDGLARGYFNRPELISERFIENPLATEEDKLRGRNLRIYKTGDLVRWRPDGDLEFIGRNDDQVKIRGLRIELGEIESKLSEHSAIKQCLATVYDHPTTGKQICAYYVSRDSGFGTRGSRKKSQKVAKKDIQHSASARHLKVPFSLSGF